VSHRPTGCQGEYDNGSLGWRLGRPDTFILSNAECVRKWGAMETMSGGRVPIDRVDLESISWHPLLGCDQSYVYRPSLRTLPVGYSSGQHHGSDFAKTYGWTTTELHAMARMTRNTKIWAFSFLHRKRFTLSTQNHNSFGGGKELWLCPLASPVSGDLNGFAVLRRR